MKVAILTGSTEVYRQEVEDKSGDVIEQIITGAGFEIVLRRALPLDKELLSNVLQSICDSEMADLVLTTGGAGCNPMDCMPEATQEIVERGLPGIPEAMRAHTMTLTKRAMLNRGYAGIRNKTMIVNLPGKPHGVRESLEYILPELLRGVEVLQKDV